MNILVDVTFANPMISPLVLKKGFPILNLLEVMINHKLAINMVGVDTCQWLGIKINNVGCMPISPRDGRQAIGIVIIKN